jgi:hypothetical protein
VKVRGIVRNGVIVTEGEPLPEGARVSVQLDEDTAPGLMTIELDENGDVIVTPELEAELAAAEAEADRGEGIPLEEFLEELRSWR